MGGGLLYVVVCQGRKKEVKIVKDEKEVIHMMVSRRTGVCTKWRDKVKRDTLTT